MATLSENALALMRWQPVQWHAMVSSGGTLISNRTWLQRHPPAQGKFHSLMLAPPPEDPSSQVSVQVIQGLSDSGNGWERAPRRLETVHSEGVTVFSTRAPRCGSKDSASRSP